MLERFKKFIKKDNMNLLGVIIYAQFLLIILYMILKRVI